MLIGVLVDVSGSMGEYLSIDSVQNEENIIRGETIFSTLIKIIKRESDFQERNDIFVLAFGLSYLGMITGDLLQLLSILNANDFKEVSGRKDLIELLGKNGATESKDYVEKYVTEQQAEFIYLFYNTHRDLLRQFIRTLPSQCKSSFSKAATDGFSYIWSGTKAVEENTTKLHTEKAIEKAKKLLTQPTKFTFQKTLDLLDRDKRNKSSVEQARSLFNRIKPYIFGETPMLEALNSAINLFKYSNDDNNYMFMITDGEASDGDPLLYFKELRDNNVTVCICLLTSKNINKPRKLYYEHDSQWSFEQKTMFELSSSVTNSNSAFTILLEKGWELPESGESRLFVQANHPLVVEEFAELVRELSNNNNALLNITARVKLDEYINASLSQFEPVKQDPGTCYANAVAAIICFARARIRGCEKKPVFKDLRDELVIKFGHMGAKTEYVLSTTAPDYKLHCKKINEQQARQAINTRRPVIATFGLYSEQFKLFHKFYKNTPKGVLTLKDLSTHEPLTNEIRHAVILIKCAPNYLTFLNSRGIKFADGGLFRVKDQSVLNLTFYDVYWELSDLTYNEKEAFERSKLESGREYADKLPSFVKELSYECPLCHVSSAINQYDGHLLKASCRKCGGSFNPTLIGLLLTPYSY